MTAASVAATRTGGPPEDEHNLIEHISGWALVVVVAMLITRLGLL